MSCSSSRGGGRKKSHCFESKKSEREKGFEMGSFDRLDRLFFFAKTIRIPVSLFPRRYFFSSLSKGVPSFLHPFAMLSILIFLFFFSPLERNESKRERDRERERGNYSSISWFFLKNFWNVKQLGNTSAENRFKSTHEWFEMDRERSESKFLVRLAAKDEEKEIERRDFRMGRV